MTADKPLNYKRYVRDVKRHSSRSQVPVKSLQEVFRFIHEKALIVGNLQD